MNKTQRLLAPLFGQGRPHRAAHRFRHRVRIAPPRPRQRFDGGEYRVVGNIVEQFTRASRYAASTGERLVDDLAAQVDAAREALTARRLRPQASAWRVVPLLVSNPVLNARLLVDRLGTNEVAAQRALAQLTDAGVLTERTGMKRNRVWQHTGILNVLDQYAQQISRH